LPRIYSFLLLLALSLLTSAAIYVSAWGNGQMFRAPYAFGAGDYRVCIAQQYRLTEVDPVYELNREQALSKLQDAADIWNLTFDCTVLEHNPEGDLEIRLRHPDRRPEPRTVGQYNLDNNIIKTYRTESGVLVELIAHEMGHALGLEHTKAGLMQPEGFCGYGLPCPNDRDLGEIRRQYWYIDIAGRPASN